MEPNRVTPRTSPQPWSSVYVSGWKVTGVGMIVDLENPDRSPYKKVHLWCELSRKDNSGLYRQLLDECSSMFEMTCAKTDCMYESRLTDQSPTPPVSIPGFSQVGVFSITQYEEHVEEWEQHLEIKTLHTIAGWLNAEGNIPDNTTFQVRLNGLNDTHKLGSLIDENATVRYIKIYYTLHPSWGNENREILAKLVDLGNITESVAHLVGYTKTTTTP
jgi:hypothetical protein